MGTETKVILASDVDHEIIADIVAVTRSRKRDERLEWDVFKLPHHCSYLSLGSDKGTHKTEPTENVKWLYEEQGHRRGRVISTSNPIPDDDTEQPPHRQAANYYREMILHKAGEFLVTMEHPKKSAPEPLVIEISGRGGAVRKAITSGVATVVSRPSQRAGRG